MPEEREEIKEIELTGVETGERLDVFLSRSLGMTRSFIQKILKEGRVTSEGREMKLKPSTRIQQGQSFLVSLPEPEGLEIEPEPVPFEVVYEDDALLVINKPAGLVVHPAPGNWRGTLVHGLLWRYPEMRLMRNRLRPGIVHRLDATTSGLMLAARSQSVAEMLQKMFQERSITKEYLALVRGVPARREGTLSGPVARDPSNPLRMAVLDGGRPALTGYRVLWSSGPGGVSLVQCSLFTGRTHQIRVHMAALGHPLAGDVLYGGPGENDSGLDRVFLHSWKLSFIHPVTQEPLSFRQPLPDELAHYLERVKFLSRK